MSNFTQNELHLFRQWFNAIQDATPAYLTPADYDAADKVAVALGMPKPRRPEGNARNAEGDV